MCNNPAEAAMPRVDRVDQDEITSQKTQKSESDHVPKIADSTQQRKQIITYQRRKKKEQNSSLESQSPEEGKREMQSPEEGKRQSSNRDREIKVTMIPTKLEDTELIERERDRKKGKNLSLQITALDGQDGNNCFNHGLLTGVKANQGKGGETAVKTEIQKGVQPCQRRDTWRKISEEGKGKEVKSPVLGQPHSSHHRHTCEAEPHNLGRPSSVITKGSDARHVITGLSTKNETPVKGIEESD